MKDQQSSLELKSLVVYCALTERAGTKQVCRPWRSEGQSQQMNAQGSAVTPGALSAALRESLQLGRAHLERRPN